MCVLLLAILLLVLFLFSVLYCSAPPLLVYSAVFSVDFLNAIASQFVLGSENVSRAAFIYNYIYLKPFFRIPGLQTTRRFSEFVVSLLNN